MSKIAGVVILYYPNSDVINYVNSYCDKLQLLIVFDNSEVKSPRLEEQFNIKFSNIHYINNPTNMGIAYCLNKAAFIARKEGFDWLLTMDQDSYFKESIFDKYLEYLEEAKSKFSELSILTVEHSDVIRKSESSFEEVRIAITSGSIINLLYWEKVVGFTEKLFIDEVDTDYVFKCLKHKLEVVKCNNILLVHELGKKVNAGYGLLINKSVRTIHSPFRIYYMVRNYLFIHQQYAHIFPIDVNKRKKELMVTLKNNLLFSNNFFRTALSIIRGYLHFKKGIYSLNPLNND